MIDHFTETLIEIATKTIPKTSPTNKRNTPWFNDECRVVIQQRNAALRKLNKEPSTSILITFKLLRAKARKIIKQTKKISYQNYVNKLNSSTQTNTVWNMIRKISGKTQAKPLKNLIKNKSEVTNIKDIADALAETFSANSSSNNKQKTENPKLSFKSNNAENYNGCFTLAELKEAIQKSHNTTLGPDEIHYEFLKQLPRRSLNNLLAALNEIWESSKFPDSWRVATIIPIPKPGKNSLYPSNYRPIALTISIREANIQRQHLIAVFFDLEKAYETTWRYGIMKDLHNMGLRGRLPNFTKAFLTDRKFQVRIGTTLSDIQQQEEGVPQGSILSVTLFNIALPIA